MISRNKFEIIESFDKISQLPDAWDQNRFYQNLLLKHAPKPCENALDIGCGTGEFTQQLSKIAKMVTAIDISEKMIQEAKKRNPAGNIIYQTADIESFKPNEQYDLIVSIATFHHLNIEGALKKIKSLLAKNGTLIALDLYDRSHTFWAILDFIALPLNLFFLRIKRRKNPVSMEETKTWVEHKGIDRYLKYKKLNEIYSRHLENFKIKRLLFWRYLLIYKKPF